MLGVPGRGGVGGGQRGRVSPAQSAVTGGGLRSGVGAGAAMCSSDRPDPDRLRHLEAGGENLAAGDGRDPLGPGGLFGHAQRRARGGGHDDRRAGGYLRPGMGDPAGMRGPDADGWGCAAARCGGSATHEKEDGDPGGGHQQGEDEGEARWAKAHGSRNSGTKLGLSQRSSLADIKAMRRKPGHAGSESDRFGLDSALLLAYVVCFVIVVALLPVGGEVAWREAGLAVGLQAVVGFLLALGPRVTGGRPRYMGVVGICLYLASVALLRDAAPPTSGYGPLALLPVVWAGLRGGRADLTAALGGLAGVYIVPTVVIGTSHYPPGVWRAGLLLIVLATVIGLVMGRLVSRVEQLFHRLGELARTDMLTGLPNRRAWQELLQRESAAARRSGEPLTVALLDLDGFKPYNDTHGHLAGDRLLMSMIAAWRSALRETDVLARWGGDEFALLLPACGVGEAQTLLERMRAACPQAPFSVGLVESGGDSSPDELVALADERLYRAKRGRPSPPATLRADADYEPTRPQGPRFTQEEARHTGLEIR